MIPQIGGVLQNPFSITQTNKQLLMRFLEVEKTFPKKLLNTRCKELIQYLMNKKEIRIVEVKVNK
jgi:hypothetical protein